MQNSPHVSGLGMTVTPTESQTDDAGREQNDHNQ